MTEINLTLDVRLYPDGEIYISTPAGDDFIIKREDNIKSVRDYFMAGDWPKSDLREFIKELEGIANDC